MIISKKRLEEIINNRMKEKEKQLELEGTRELFKDSLILQRRRIERLEDCQYKRIDEMQAKIEELREMLLKNCGKQPPENAEKE